MREVDELSIRKHGIPSLKLMENAGKSLFYFFKEKFDGLKKKTILVVCGTGNNAGDGLVLARYLCNFGVKTKICILSCHEPSGSNDFKINFKKIPRSVDIFYLDNLKKLDAFQKLLNLSDIVVDGIFGTGLKKDITGVHFQVIERLNLEKKIKVAIDIPSGLDSDTGTVRGICFKSDYTVTFGLPKLGFYICEGPDYTGKIVVKDIGFPREVINKIKPGAFLLEEEDVLKILPQRNVLAHKGSCGGVLIVGGSTGFTGAVTLAGFGALRSGAGLVYIAIPESLNPIMEVKNTEAITIPVKETKGGYLCMGSFSKVAEVSKDADVIILGPGLGRNKETILLVKKILEKINKPFVVDADALYALSKARVKIASNCVILTPHPLEFSRLVNKDVKEILKAPLKILKEYASKMKVCVVFKKAYTLIATPSGEIYINPTGNPALATAGTGDVLSGMIGAFLAQLKNPEHGAVLGAYFHGKSADEYIKEKDYLSLIASDLLKFIPFVLKKARRGGCIK